MLGFFFGRGYSSWRTAAPAVIILHALIIIAACSAPAPTPTPTATPIPTPTPTPVPALSMRDFTLDPSTTGKDLFDRLSEQESACVKEVMGDAAYQAMLSFPLLAATGDPAAAAPIFGCMTPENTVLAGVAFLDTAAGGRSNETRECIADFALQRPEFIYARLGIEPPEASAFNGEETRDTLVGFYDCMTESEAAAALAELYASIDNLSPLAGEDLVALLPEPEASCVRDSLPEAEYAAMLNATPLRAAGIGVNAAECLTLDSSIAFLRSSAAAQFGALSDASAACADDFIRTHPTHIATIASHIYADPSQSSPAEFVDAAISGFDLFLCLNEDELAGVEDLLAALGS